MSWKLWTNNNSHGWSDFITLKNWSINLYPSCHLTCQASLANSKFRVNVCWVHVRLPKATSNDRTDTEGIFSLFDNISWNGIRTYWRGFKGLTTVKRMFLSVSLQTTLNYSVFGSSTDVNWTKRYQHKEKV